MIASDHDLDLAPIGVLTPWDGEHDANNSAFVVLLDLDKKLIAFTAVNAERFFVIARRALRAAIRHDATSIIVGIPRLGRNPAPTNNDFAVSKALVDGTRAIGLTLLPRTSSHFIGGFMSASIQPAGSWSRRNHSFHARGVAQ